MSVGTNITSAVPENHYAQLADEHLPVASPRVGGYCYAREPAQRQAGGRYRVGTGQIVVDSVELVPFSGIPGGPADLRRCGEPDIESLRMWAAHAGAVHDDTLLYRVEFHAE